MGEICRNIELQGAFDNKNGCAYGARKLQSSGMKGSKKGGGRKRRPPPFGFDSLLYMVAREVASIAKTYRRTTECALNMYIDAYT